MTSSVRITATSCKTTGGYAEKVPVDEKSKNSKHEWYIPHHRVYHRRRQEKPELSSTVVQYAMVSPLTSSYSRDQIWQIILPGSCADFGRIKLRSCVIFKQCSIKSRSTWNIANYWGSVVGQSRAEGRSWGVLYDCSPFRCDILTWLCQLCSKNHCRPVCGSL